MSGEVCSCSEDKTSSSSEPWDSSNSDSDEGNNDAFLQAQRRLRKCQKQESHLLSDIQSLTQEKNMLKGENTCLTMENAFLKEQVLEKQYERDSIKVQWWEEKQEFLLKIGRLEDQCGQNQLRWDGRFSEIRTAQDQELEAKQEEVRRLGFANDRLRDDNRVLIERNGECEDRVRELESRLHTKTESLNKLNVDLKQQLREVSNGVIQLRLVLSELGEDFETERTQVASEMLNTQMSFKQTTNVLTAELCSRQDEVNQLRSKIQSDERSFRERAEAHDNLVTELKSSNSEMEEEMKKLSTVSEKLKSDLEREQQMNKRLSSDLSNLQAEYREVQVSKSTLHQTVVHLEQTINNNLMEYNSETSSLKTQILELHKNLQIKTSEIDRMSVEASELKDQFENCKKGRCTRQDCGMIQDNYQVLVNDHTKLQELYKEQHTQSTRMLTIIADLESQCEAFDGKAQIESNIFSGAEKVDELKQQNTGVQETTENTTEELQEQLTVLDESHKLELYEKLQIRSTEIDRMKEEDSELKNETEKVVSGFQERQSTSQDYEIVPDNYQVLEDDHTKLQELYEEQQTDLESESAALDEKGQISEAQKTLTELNKALNEIVKELKQQDIGAQQTTENTREELQEQLTVLDESHKCETDRLKTKIPEQSMDLQIKSTKVNRTTGEAELKNETEKAMSGLQERQGTSQDCEIVQSQCEALDGKTQYGSNIFSGAQKVDELKQQDIVVQETTENTTEELQEQLTVLDEAHIHDFDRVETGIPDLKLQEEQQTESTRLSNITADLESQCASLDGKSQIESNTFCEAQKTLTELNKALSKIVEELKQQDLGVQQTTENNTEELQYQLTVPDETHKCDSDRVETGIPELCKDLQVKSTEVDRTREEDSELKNETEKVMSGLEERQSTSQDSEIVQDNYQVLEDDQTKLQELYEEQQTERTRLSNIIPNLESQCAALDEKVKTESNTLSEAQKTLTELNKALNEIVEELKQQDIGAQQTTENTREELQEQLTEESHKRDSDRLETEIPELYQNEVGRKISTNDDMEVGTSREQIKQVSHSLHGALDGKENTEMESFVSEGSNEEATQEVQLEKQSFEEDNISLSGLDSDLTTYFEEETNKLREEEVSSDTLLKEEPKTEGLTSSEMLEQLTMLRQENSQLVSDKSNLAADLNNLQSRYKKVLADKTEQYQKALSDLHNLRTQLVGAKEDIGNIQGLWNEAKDSLERRVSLESKNTVEEFEQQLKNQTEEVRQLKKQCRTLEENLTFLTKTSEEREKQDKEELEKRETERDNLLITVGDLEKKLKLSKNEVTDYINEANKLKDVISKRDSVIEQRSADVNGLRSQVSEMQHQLSEAELDLMKRDDLLSNQIEERKQNEQLVTELRENLDECKQENSRLKKELEDRQEEQIFKNLSEELSESTLSENSEGGPSNSVSPNQSLSTEQPIPSDYEGPKTSTSDVQHPNEEGYAEEEDRSDSGFGIVLQRLSTTENEVALESSDLEESETSTDNETDEQSTVPLPPESAAVNTEAKPSTFKQVAKRVARGVLVLSAWALSCSIGYILGQQDMMSCDPLSYYSSSCYKYDISGTGIPF